MNHNTVKTESTNPLSGRGLVPLRAATEWLGMHDTRVTMRLVRDGRLKAIKLGNRVMITGKSLRDFVEA